MNCEAWKPQIQELCKNVGKGCGWIPECSPDGLALQGERATKAVSQDEGGENGHYPDSDGEDEGERAVREEVEGKEREPEAPHLRLFNGRAG